MFHKMTALQQIEIKGLFFCSLIFHQNGVIVQQYEMYDLCARQHDAFKFVAIVVNSPDVGMYQELLAYTFLPL